MRHGHYYIREKLDFGPKGIDRVVVIGKSAGDPLLREALVEVLGE